MTASGGGGRRDRSFGYKSEDPDHPLFAVCERVQCKKRFFVNTKDALFLCFAYLRGQIFPLVVVFCSAELRLIALPLEYRFHTAPFTVYNSALPLRR